MNCPHCNVPLMGGMTVCPKCKYDTKTTDGGEKHKQWLEANRTPTPEEIREKEAEQNTYSKEKREALASMLITSGFNFDGYRIVRYSGYISGDDVIQIKKEKGFFTGLNKVNVGLALSESLVKIRRQALAELKEAAYDLGCNAVIGVDFDYITLDPEVHNGQFTEDLPYVFCVTANGNAVVIEKE